MGEARTRLPVIFISHGGGPCFWTQLPPPFTPTSFDGLAAYLRGLDARIGVRPRAVLVVSGHWETERPTVNVAAHPPLLFDYFGFPEHTYRLTYPAPGSPEVAARVRAVLAAAGIASDAEAERGLDHGVFVPFKLIYPEADVPIVEMSIRHDLDPAAHIAIGRALEPLREEGVLIVGSGFSYHNLRALFGGADDRASEAFDAWLVDAVTDSDPEARARKLIRWQEAPAARLCHPREDHLIPLMVAAGAAGVDPGRHAYADRIAGKAVSGFEFGGRLKARGSAPGPCWGLEAPDPRSL